MILDCFIFYNELDILEGRLEYLNDIVDKFVIVELDVTHTGKPKPYNYLENEERYKKYADKIVYYKASLDVSGYKLDYHPDYMDFGTDHWKIENRHRNFIADAIKDFDDADFVIISDVDEIPSKSAIKNSIKNLNANCTEIACIQKMFYYNFNQKQVHDWCGSVITTKKLVQERSPQWFRNVRWNTVKIKNGGWHLTYWGGVDKIKNKLSNFAHQEYNSEKYINDEYIKSKIAAGDDLFGRIGNPFEKVNKEDINPTIYSIFEKYVK